MANEAEAVMTSEQDLLRLSVEIVAAHVRRNSVAPEAAPDLLRTVHGALRGLTDAPATADERPKPAVPISKSIQHDFIVCLEDGKKLKMLKRYLRPRYDMSPDDYPMVAPAYAAWRSDFARQIGLGLGVRRRK